MAVTNVGGYDLKLMQKNTKIESKPFCFEVAESSNLQIFRITQNDVSICFPISFSSRFLEFFDEFVDVFARQTKQLDFTRKEESISVDDNKMLHCVSGRDQWGFLVKISEALPCKNPLIVQSSYVRTGRNVGWKTFRDTIADMAATACVFFPPHKDICNKRIGQIAAEISEREQDLPVICSSHPDAESSKERVDYKFSKSMTAEDKQFVFELGLHKGTNLLKVYEIDGNRRCCIEVPLIELHQFHEYLGDFLDTVKESTPLAEE